MMTKKIGALAAVAAIALFSSDVSVAKSGSGSQASKTSEQQNSTAMLGVGQSDIAVQIDEVQKNCVNKRSVYDCYLQAKATLINLGPADAPPKSMSLYVVSSSISIPTVSVISSLEGVPQSNWSYLSYSSPLLINNVSILKGSQHRIILNLKYLDLNSGGSYKIGLHAGNLTGTKSFNDLNKSNNSANKMVNLP